MIVNDADTAVPLASVLEDALSPLESLATILAAGGHEDVASVSAGLLRDARAQLQSVARCLEAGCGRQLMLRDFGGALALVPCPGRNASGCPAA